MKNCDAVDRITVLKVFKVAMHIEKAFKEI